MARTNIPVSPLVAEVASYTPLSDPAGTAADQANGMNVVMTSESIPPANDAYRGLLIRFHNSAAGSQNIIIRAGVNPPAMRAPLGDLTLAVAAAATVWIGPLDMARHAQADDSVNIDFNVGTTGTVTAFTVPRTV